jgi:hypothetical protein
MAQMQMGAFQHKQQAAADALAKQAGLQQAQAQIFQAPQDQRPELLTGLVGEYGLPAYTQTQKALGLDPELSKTRSVSEKAMRKEFMGLPPVKDFAKISDAMGRIQKSAEKPSAAGDMAMIFNFMKVLDPGSTVREGEFASAEQATGVPGRVVNLYNRLLKGERLSPPQRADFYNRARSLYTGQAEGVRTLSEQYRGLAERRQLDPQNILFSYERDFPEMEVPVDQPVSQEITKKIGDTTYVKRGDQWFEK